MAREYFKVYSGKVNRCCCGCSGKWTVTQAEAAANPYSDVSDRSVKIIVNKILRSGVQKQDSAGLIYAEVGGKLYMAQFRKAA